MNNDMVSLLASQICSSGEERRDLHIIIAALAKKLSLDITDAHQASKLIWDMAYFEMGIEMKGSDIENILEEVCETVELYKLW